MSSVQGFNVWRRPSIFSTLSDRRERCQPCRFAHVVRATDLDFIRIHAMPIRSPLRPLPPCFPSTRPLDTPSCHCWTGRKIDAPAERPCAIAFALPWRC